MADRSSEDDEHKVIPFPDIKVERLGDEPPNEFLEKAKAWGLAQVVVLGFDEDGQLQWGGSHIDAYAVNWLLDRAKLQLFEDVPKEPTRPA